MRKNPKSSHDSLRQFVAMRDALVAERAALKARLTDLDRVLGAVEAGTKTNLVPDRPSKPGRRPQSEMKLKDAIAKATERKPLQIQELVTAVQDLGFRFASTNPKNSLGAYLYGPSGKKYFKKTDAGFSVR